MRVVNGELGTGIRYTKQNKRKPSVIKTNNVYVTLKENKNLQTLEPKVPLSVFVNKVLFEPGLRLGWGEWGRVVQGKNGISSFFEILVLCTLGIFFINVDYF